jgi:hypothetical protein
MDSAFWRLLPSIAIVAVLGCSGEKTTPISQKTAEERIMGGTSPSDQEKVKEYLKKANIEGNVVALEDKGQFWIADVMKVAAPGKRGRPTPPDPYRIEKSDGKVTKI